MKIKNFFALNIFLLFTATCHGQSDFVVKDFHVTVNINTDGVMDVEETIEVFFHEKRRGILRTVPYIFDVENKRHQINVSGLKSTSHKDKVSKKDGNQILRMGDPNKYLTGKQVYVIQYQVASAFMDRGQEAEFFWNLTGNDWKVPLEKVSYRITFPDALDISKDNLRIYSGPYGSRYSEVENRIEGSVLSGFSTTPIYPGSGLSVAVMMPKSIFNDGAVSMTSTPVSRTNSRHAASTRQKIKDIYFPIPLALLTLFGWQFWSRGRDPKEPIVTLQHHPPSGMTPTEVGTFHDFQVNDRDLIALIPKWGHEGLIRISSHEAHAKDDMYFSKIAELPASAPAYEQTLFRGLFRNSNGIFLNEMKNKFYKIFSASKSQVRKTHLFSDLFDESTRKTFHGNWLIAAIVALIVAGVILMMMFQMFFTGAASIILAFVGLIIKSQRPRLSERGLIINRKLIGFREFLANPDPQELTRLMEADPDYLNKVFPYVVAFGLDKEWDFALKDMSVSAPYWYGQDNNMRSTYGDFSKSFSVREISSAFSSMPASKSSRGGSGRGFSGGSGGGFGGGGGSSW